ncbi:centrosomal protein of 41 kDa B-like [Hydractinia symbiolongicarpus]|uniref:centrosomal protein of 41 kDa B-like n=1 Tax=Hydractinia symbiolongicarpus TaxID=13093 RepID=UPI00254EDE38|nr:centrosomal protein of 41 kDa B-like [Hydractinia symbiolongicarpus]
MAASNARKKDIFQKKIPQNPRYQHVKSTLDTGASVSNYMSKLEETRKNYRFRKDEIFKRMKVSTFAQLVLQVAEVVNIELERQLLETARTEENNEEEEEEVANEQCNGTLTDRSLLQNVVRGFGEVDLNGESDNPSENKIENEEKDLFLTPEPTSLPYLLLDVRDKDAYNECHIIGALNYPSAMLARSVNYLTKEMLLFKNKTGKVIIIYDDDEKIAPNVSTVLVQREIDNVIMLSGGMKVLNKKFPGCFMTGTLPSTCFSPRVDRKGKPRPPPQITENENVEWYSSELLERMQDSLDEVLLNNESSRMSSRLSTGRSTKASSRMSTSSNKSNTSQKTWR